MAPAEFIPQLDKISTANLYKASTAADVRMQLYLTGRTHELFSEFAKDARAKVMQLGGRDGILNGASGYVAQSELMKMWGDAFKPWQDTFDRLRKQAVKIPFGVLAVEQKRLVLPEVGLTPLSSSMTSPQMTSSFRGRKLNESVVDGVFDSQYRTLLNAAEEYLYGDGLSLSDRVWKLDRDTRKMITDIIMDGVANKKSAWDISQLIDQTMGANDDCPRWTSSRLYGMTPADRMSNPTGLLSGDACDGSGVSYNALRLARTAIQKVHALATDKVMEMQPWVTGEQINLSAAHAEDDECDDVADGGENGDGVYPKGEIELPIHPNCLCFKTSVQISNEEFTSRMHDWMTGEGDWPEMDQYADDIGGNIDNSVMPESASLAVWLFGKSPEELDQ
jgi:hypothetical protein